MRILRKQSGILRIFIEEGKVSISKERIRAILELKKPENLTELHAWIGALVRLRKFDRRLAEASAGMCAASGRFVWGPAQEESFIKCREILSSGSFSLSRMD